MEVGHAATDATICHWLLFNGATKLAGQPRGGRPVWERARLYIVNTCTTTNGTHVRDSSLSRKEVESANERAKRVLGDANGKTRNSHRHAIMTTAHLKKGPPVRHFSQ